jgi:dipeptidyl aminopeptidase/acylaminoacyl peptidase
MHSFGVGVALVVTAISAPMGASAQQAQQPARISTDVFASLPVLRSPKLSPDGRRIVARNVADGKVRLIILDADKPGERGQVIPLGEAAIYALQWAGNRRLLITAMATSQVYGMNLPYLRLLAVDTDTGAARLVDAKSRGMLGGDVLYADPTGTWALVASQNTLSDYPSVKRVDLGTGIATVVEKAKTGVWNWYADDNGVVRAGMALDGRRYTVWYRDSASEPLRPLRGKVSKNDDDSTVDRFIFGRTGNAWVVTNERTGKFALYKYEFASSSIAEPIFEHPTADIDNVIYEPLSGEISGLTYHDDRRRTVWLDPERKELQKRIDKALPNTVNNLTDWSDDGNRVMVWSSGGSDPGRYFLLDQKSSKMHPVVDPYPQIEPAQLAPVKAVRYVARDGLSIPAYVTLPLGREAKNLPLVVMPHGGPFARDEWSYDPLVQFLANRGYAVLQPQFRGSTGYGKDFVAKGYGQYGRAMQDDLDDGVDWMMKAGQIDAKRVCIFGASYGGYAAMWGAIRNQDRYRCAASWAGVSDLATQLRYDRKGFAATRYFKEWRTRVAGDPKFDLRTVSPLSFADKLKIPIFIAHGEADKTVPVTQSQTMVTALSKAGADVTSIFYKESGHDFGSTADYADFLKRLEAFLAKNNPA